MTIAGDRVELRIGADEVVVATQYDVRLGVFDQPAAFSLSLGSGTTAADLLQRYPKNSPFQLVVAGQRQFAGYTDGNRVSGDAGATEMAIQGRDVIKFLHDSFHEREASYTASTTAELLGKALAELDMQRPYGTPGQRPFVLASNSATRNMRTGATIPATGDDYTAELLTPVGTVGNGTIVLRAKLGERWSDLLGRNLEQSGLFMWGSPDGDIVVGRPNVGQAPLYRIIRQRGGSRKPINNVLSFSFQDNLAPRYSEVVIYGHATGRKYARTEAKGAYVDAEMVNAGVHKILVLRDVDVTSAAHAELMAKRYLAAARRKGFSLEYTVAGHSTQRLGGRPQDRVVWAPDTMVEVNDEELGLAGNYWVESVRHQRGMSRGTTSTIRLVPPEALLFGTDAPEMSTDEKAKAAAAVPVGVNLRSLPLSEPLASIPKSILAKIPSDVMTAMPPGAQVRHAIEYMRTAHPELLYRQTSFSVTSPHRKIASMPLRKPLSFHRDKRA